MNLLLTRRDFVGKMAAGAAGLSLLPSRSRAASQEAFSFLVLGDLHFDGVRYHDLDSLQREKPDDVRQIRDYSNLTSQIMPRLFGTVRRKIARLNASPETRVAFTVQVGDLVEGLCANSEQQRQQNADAVGFVRQARLGVPFLFAKGNHDVTGPGSSEAFQEVFHPFLSEQAAPLLKEERGPGSARYSLQYGGALFCFFDAYDKESLGWLEGVLARRSARHCFVVVHPPVVPYGARSTWHLFSQERQSAQRERLLDLLGKHNAFVLSGHIHKYNLLARSTRAGGCFLQLGISSVIASLEIHPEHLLSGVASYNADQVAVEPNFSPGTEAQRRAVYQAEIPFVKEFQYASLPGYAVVTVNGPKVSAEIYAGVGDKVWRTLDLARLMSA